MGCTGLEQWYGMVSTDLCRTCVCLKQTLSRARSQVCTEATSRKSRAKWKSPEHARSTLDSFARSSPGPSPFYRFWLWSGPFWYAYGREAAAQRVSLHTKCMLPRLGHLVTFQVGEVVVLLAEDVLDHRHERGLVVLGLGLGLVVVSRRAPLPTYWIWIWLYGTMPAPSARFPRPAAPPWSSWLLASCSSY